MKKEKIIWEHTPIIDEEFDKERMEILKMKIEEYSQFCCKLSVEDVIVLNTEDKTKIQALKRKYSKK